jgi:hypothetical protein
MAPPAQASSSTLRAATPQPAPQRPATATQRSSKGGPAAAA